jgi:hypothetical protein
MNSTHASRSPITPTRSRSINAAVLALLLAAATSSVQAGDWRWTVTPYAWATDISVDVKIADRSVVDEEIPVSDLLEDLDTIAQIRLEAQSGKHGVMVDLFDVTLSDESDSIELPDGAGDALLDSDVGMTIVDLAALYNPKGDRSGFSLYYGTRVLNQRASIDANFLLASGASARRSYEADETLVDALVGVRFHKNLSRRWSYQLQADASLGGTEYTWSIGPSLSYAIGNTGRYAISAGYRRMKIDFEDQDELDTEMTLSGALVGFRISF